MKQFNDITIIGIDQGYGNMKTANTIFPTAITAYDTAPMFKGDVLEYGGRFYRVGEGHKGFVADKSEDGDFYLLTLAAIAKEIKHSVWISKRTFGVIPKPPLCADAVM